MREAGGGVRPTTPIARRAGVARAQDLPQLAATPMTRERTPLRGTLGQGLLLVEGLTVGVLGGVALAWSMAHSHFGADGVPLLGLKLTPWHGGLFLVVGTAALLACLGRRAALVFSGLTACGWAALSVVCTLAVAHHAPGVLGFDSRDSVFYGVLGVYNLIAWICLAPIPSRIFARPGRLRDH